MSLRIYISIFAILLPHAPPRMAGSPQAATCPHRITDNHITLQLMMKKFLAISAFVAVASAVQAASGDTAPCYSNNREPLLQKPYIELPLGSIRAKGWLLEMLRRQKDGASGQMDTLYPEVMGQRNGWLGGDGDQWERGPYWIDGLLPLAYILDDKELKKKVQPWIEWTLKSQREDGYFGPAKDYGYEPGLQRDNSADWWPRMVVLKIMQQYYSATQDRRVVDFMTRYFHYQLATLPSKPLGNWTFWAEYRACDNLQAVYWLYNITGDEELLRLASLLHSQGYDFTGMFFDGKELTSMGGIHCVNLAQGLKEPVIYYQQSKDEKYLRAVKKGLSDLRRFNGQPQGMYGGDERLHGNVPTQGSELCSAVEMMFSLEKMMEITGDMSFAGHLERVAFNALPTQITDDFMYKQYFQQANQVMITRHRRNFYEEGTHKGTDIVFGTLSGYPCCFSNMHQGWPKFTQSLWYATPDNGLAAYVYSPSEVTARVADGYEATLSEETCYPMEGTIRFRIKSLRDGKKQKAARFPLHLRIPGWCDEAEVWTDGNCTQKAKGGEVVVIDRLWEKGDVVELRLPMSIRTQSWYEKSVSIERGPLVYALRLQEKRLAQEQEPYGVYEEVTTDDPWNYGLVNTFLENINEKACIRIDTVKQQSAFPWNLESAPIEIKVKARRIPTWQLYNESAGPLPFSFCNKAAGQEEEVTLIPYGCTTLRISEFPIVGPH